MSYVKQSSDGLYYIRYGGGVTYYKRGVKKELKQFKRYTDKPIVVVGSAPGVFDDLERCPKENCVIKNR